MNEVKDKSIRIDRVLRMFSKSGGRGNYTMPFSELPDAIQNALSLKVEIAEVETPILASYRDSDTWVVLTSDRLVWCNGQAQESLMWQQIRDATIPMSAFAALKSSAKLENAVLEVSTDSGKVEILVEAGKPFSGFWNVLKMIPRLA